ncbi:hypothetical protein BJ166DRAFT_530782 [Pestalotiopsis sp. NC0098]|nr:hypothetical protein BJ166DRAFT_530782 [Pestalotiopsis sp. NC0098]
MVAYDTIQASNRLLNDASAPSVSVFVGGTSGIGQLTVRALVATGASMRIYLVGRQSSAERIGAFIQELYTVNPRAEIIWTEGEVSLLADTKRVCQVIQSKESRVDLLFLTAGYAPLGGRKYTSEGLEITQALEYYSRMLFIHHLLPLLNKAEAARVINVLAGGMERAGVDLDDLDLRKPSWFGHLKARMQVVAMMTTTMEVLAGANRDVAFVHSMPGWVDTGNVHRGVDPRSLTGWLVWLFLAPLIGLLAMSSEVSGQRYLFQSTSAAFGGRGVPWSGEPGVNSLGKKQENGLFLVDYKADCTKNAKNLAKLREQAQGPIWDHTQNVLGPYM